MVYLSTYGAALASWLLVLGAVRPTAAWLPRRVYGLNADSKVNFESFEQSTNCTTFACLDEQGRRRTQNVPKSVFVYTQR